MAVPDTDTFTLQDVVNEVNPTTDDLVDCFADAVASKFDSAYSGSKNQLLNFRNYGAAISLVEFPITASTFANPLFACFQSTSSNSAFFPNGAPTINDVVYANAAGSVFLGAGNWGVNASSTQSNFRMTIDSNGKITAYNPC